MGQVEKVIGEKNNRQCVFPHCQPQCTHTTVFWLCGTASWRASPIDPQNLGFYVSGRYWCQQYVCRNHSRSSDKREILWLMKVVCLLKVIAEGFLSLKSQLSQVVASFLPILGLLKAYPHCMLPCSQRHPDQVDYPHQ